MNEDIKIKKENLIRHKVGNISKEYIFGKEIGKGTFGQARLAIHKPTKQLRDIKIIKKRGVNLENLINEISILSKLSHPSIIKNI